MKKFTDVAIDTGPLSSGDAVRGIGVYTRQLMEHLDIVGIDAFKDKLKDYKVVHLTRFNPFRLSVPLVKPRGTGFALTIYDLIPLIYTKNYPPGIKGSFVWQLNKMLIKKNVDEIITISETSKKDICRLLGAEPSKVHVIHLAPGKAFVKKNLTAKESADIQKRFNLPKQFALYVGDVNYNKNIPVLIKACKDVGIKLVICGKQAAEIENMDLSHPELSHLDARDFDDVISLGFVDDENLNLIYNLASVYIQPSLYEGFGLPVVEAMSAGCPVVSSRTQALFEIAGDSCEYADPNNYRDFSSKIKKILKLDDKEKSKIVSAAISKSREYSWSLSAEKTAEVYEKLRKKISD